MSNPVRVLPFTESATWATPGRGEVSLVAQPGRQSLLRSLRAAIARGDEAHVQGLLAGATATTLNEAIGPEGTPLLLEVACHTQNPQRLTHLLRQLLDRGANPSARDANGTDALMALLGRTDAPVEAVTLLLRRQAEVQRVNRQGLSPLQLLLLGWRGEALFVILQMLLKRNVDLHSATPRGKTPLWLAACAPDGPRLVSALLEACPPQEITRMVQISCSSSSGERGNAGTAALLHQEDDAATEIILAQLKRHGLHLRVCEDEACALIGTRTIERDFQGFRDRCNGALRRLAEGPNLEPARSRPRTKPQALLQGPVMLPAPQVGPPRPAAHQPTHVQQPQLQVQHPPRVMLTPPSIERAGPEVLVRPLPVPGAQPHRNAPPRAPVGPQPAAAPSANPQTSAIAPAPKLKEPLSQHYMPPARALFVVNPEPPSQPTTVQNRASMHADKPVLGAQAAVAAAPAHSNHCYATLSLHQVARSGPFEALDEVIAQNPHALTIRDHLRDGGHMPLTLAVLSRDSRHVSRMLQALKDIDKLRPEVIDTPGTDGRCALAVAIEINGQRQVKELLQAGASPLLPIPQARQGFARALKWSMQRPAAHAAEHAVRLSRPYILTLLLEWDERDAQLRRSRRFTFDLSALMQLAQSLDKKLHTPALRAALEDAGKRRRRAPDPGRS